MVIVWNTRTNVTCSYEREYRAKENANLLLQVRLSKLEIH